MPRDAFPIGSHVRLRVADPRYPRSPRPLPGLWRVDGRQGGMLIVSHRGLGASLRVSPSVVHRANPEPSVAAAREGFEAFHWGDKPKHVYRARIPAPRGALYEIGSVHSIAYSTHKDKKRATWEHEFAEHGRGRKPRLVTDGKRLFMVGGDYRIKPEGITG